MNFSPEPYQQLMHDHLVGHSHAALFAGIGLGKTSSTLNAFRTLYAEGAARSMLVVAPMRVANMTWPNEAAKWDQFKGFKVERLRDVKDVPSGRAHIYTTNYERLPKLGDLDAFDIICFDELTKAKNPQSERIKALRPLLGQDRVRWGLTGTPRPNSLLELFAQVRLLDDGKRLGPSFSAFRSAWFEATDYNQYNWEPKPDAERKIYERIHDLVLTLKSSDYLDVPDIVEEDIEVTLPQAAHGIYKQLERELMVLIQGREVVAVNAAVLVNKLLQVCGGAVYSGEEPNKTVVQIHQAKLHALKRLLVDLGDERAIIACNFIHERQRVCAAVEGAVDAHAFKGDLEDAWNSGRIRHLVADPRGLGHGLNLQKGGRTVIHYSPTWSRELYDQINGRVARKGQENVPQVFRLECPGTMDSVVYETLRTRGDAQGAMMTLLSNFRLQGLCFNP